jgi:hypothetical protein
MKKSKKKPAPTKDELIEEILENILDMEHEDLVECAVEWRRELLEKKSLFHLKAIRNLAKTGIN